MCTCNLRKLAKQTIALLVLFCNNREHYFKYRKFESLQPWFLSTGPTKLQNFVCHFAGNIFIIFTSRVTILRSDQGVMSTGHRPLKVLRSNRWKLILYIYFFFCCCFSGRNFQNTYRITRLAPTNWFKSSDIRVANNVSYNNINEQRRNLPAHWPVKRNF